MPEYGTTYNNYADEYAQWVDTPNLIFFNNGLRFDVDGTEDDCLKFMDGLEKLCRSTFINSFSVNDVFSARQEGYGTYGGLLFLGVYSSVSCSLR